MTKKLKSDGNSTTKRIHGQSMWTNCGLKLTQQSRYFFSNDLYISNCFVSVVASIYPFCQIQIVLLIVTDLIFDREGTLNLCSNSDGVDEAICSHNYKHNIDRMFYAIKCIINMMFVHGHAPNRFFKSYCYSYS